MQFSEEDADLVEIINAIGEVAGTIHSGNLKISERTAKITYAGTLVENYLDYYVQENKTVPGKPLFSEAIKWYLDTYMQGEPRALSKSIRNIMRELIFGSYKSYKKRYYNPIEGPGTAFA